MVEGASVDVSNISQKLHNAIQESDWQTNKQAAKDLSGLLAVLNTYTPDPTTMRETRIGVVVNKLRKHTDDCVKAYASRLTEKWKAALDVKSSSSKAKPAVVASSTYTKIPETSLDSQKGDAARLRVQQAYANERAKKDSRTSIFLDKPVVKKVRGRKAVPSATTITRFTNPERANMTQKVPRGVAPSSYNSSSLSSSGGGARPPAKPQSSVPARPALKSNQSTSSAPHAASTAKMTPEELRHHQRQMKLRALAEQKARATGKTVPFTLTYDDTPAPTSKSAAPVPSKFTAIQRQKPSGTYVDKRKMNSSSSSAAAAHSKLTPDEQKRKDFLDKMYPRTIGRPDANTNLKQKRKRGDETAAKPKPLKPGEREVMHWLKGLDGGDMSQYAQVFFDNGFDTMKLMATMVDEDLPTLIPKRGHCRVVEVALQALRRSSGKADRPDPRPKKKQRRSYSDDEDYDTDDSFVVNDGDAGFRTGSITAMMMKKRGNYRGGYDYDDEEDLSDMEASYDEIQREEYRSAKYGDYEDEVEDRRNRIHKAKKQKRK